MNISFKHLSPSHLILGGNVRLIQFHWHEPFLKIYNEKCSQEGDGTEVSTAVIKNY